MGQNTHAGTFGFEVRNVGRDDQNNIFLNSELNYRDQINVSVRIDFRVVRYLMREHGQEWFNEVTGRSIEVTGEAKRQEIRFINPDRSRSNAY